MRKKFTILALATASISFLTGFVVNGTIKRANINDIREFVDPDTGVHYLIYDRYGGITPRLNSDGSVMTWRDKWKG